MCDRAQTVTDLLHALNPRRPAARSAPVTHPSSDASRTSTQRGFKGPA